MPIDSKHPDYKKHESTWDKIRACLDGRVREFIIPVTYGRNKDFNRDENYKNRAIFSNFTRQTRNGLVGTALSDPWSLEVPPQMEYLRTSATGTDKSLSQLINLGLNEATGMARLGMLTDYPVNSTQTGLARIYPYKTEDIINWGLRNYNGVQKLDFLVLREKKLKRDPKDKYKWIEVFQYRELTLDEKTGYYNVSFVSGDGKTVVPPFAPKANGQFLDYIPFDLAGSEDNDFTVDNSIIEPIAELNIGHLRNSASLEDNADAHGQGTLMIFAPGLNQSQLDKLGTIMQGSREGYIFPVSGTAELLQLEPNQLCMAMMDQKVENMINLGAHIIRPGSANAPVETTKIVQGSKLSQLDVVVVNFQAALLSQLRNCALFNKVNPDLVEFNMGMDYIDKTADAQVLTQLVSSWQAGAIPLSVYYRYARQAGLIPKEMTDDQIKEEIAEEPPVPGLNFGENQI